MHFGIVFGFLLNQLHAFHTSCLPANFGQRGLETVWCWCMKMCYLLSSNYLLFTLLLRTINLSLSIGLGAEFLWGKQYYMFLHCSSLGCGAGTRWVDDIIPWHALNVLLFTWGGKTVSLLKKHFIGHGRTNNQIVSSTLKQLFTFHLHPDCSKISVQLQNCNRHSG